MSTITRRRVAGASSSTTTQENDNSTSQSSPGVRSPFDETAEKKIAYDPNDVDETTSTPRLTLMEEVLLLGLKDRQVIRTYTYTTWSKGIDV